MTIGDLEKIPVRVKIVADDRPNEDGREEILFVALHRVQPITDWRYFDSVIDKGYHVVKVEQS